MSAAELLSELARGDTSLCRLWHVTRRDGLAQGFTDHDCDLAVDGLTYRANSGLTASALQQSAGLSVDNSEALGAISQAGLTEADLRAGRYDGADVQIWLADWTRPHNRRLIFRGSLGEVVVHGAAFRAELRGLAEALACDQGRSYSRQCGAVLGDARCGFDLAQPGFRLLLPMETCDAEARILRFSGLAGFADRWFEGGRCRVLAGAAAGISCMIKADRVAADALRQIELWQSIRADLQPGDALELTAGCDKSPNSCRQKFNNFINFQGFPHLPSQDWLTAYPGGDQPALGGSQMQPPPHD